MSIAILFILLSAQLRLTDFTNFIFDNGIWLILGVVILICPLGVIASSFSTDLGIRERCFLSWMAPRGIVAGSMASLFALKLEPVWETKQIFYRRSRSALLDSQSSFRA